LKDELIQLFRSVNIETVGYQRTYSSTNRFENQIDIEEICTKP